MLSYCQTLNLSPIDQSHCEGCKNSPSFPKGVVGSSGVAPRSRWVTWPPPITTWNTEYQAGRQCFPILDVKQTVEEAGEAAGKNWAADLSSCASSTMNCIISN